MRAYIAACPSLRRIPVGLISADNDRKDLAAYYNCNENPKEDPFDAAEFFGLNSYVFCDGNVTEYEGALGYNTLAEDIASLNYSIPFLLTEFGCLSKSFEEVDGYPGQRNFLQAKWMYSEPSLREITAGGFAFE